MSDWKEILRTLAASADGVYAVDKKQRVVFWSEAAEQITGLPAADVLGRPCYEVMQGKDYEENTFCRRNCPTMVAVRRGSSVPNYDLESRTRDGKSIWLNMSIIPVRRRRREGPLAVHMFRDVTARRRAERLARETLTTVERFASEGREQIIEATPSPAPSPTLTPRELEVLRLLADGVGTKEMAERLSLSIATVRNHIERILAKLGVHSRLEAVLYAAQHNLI
jgi:PAS domain S-box-containing protein